jgi:hypothetical protein
LELLEKFIEVPISKFMAICSVRVALIYVDRQMDGHEEIIGAFCDYANVPKMRSV